MTDSDDTVHLRLDALHRRLRYIEQTLEQLHARLGLGPMPERPAPGDDETEGVRRLLSEGREQEALRLHLDLTGQGVEEVQDVFESLRAGL